MHRAPVVPEYEVAFAPFVAVNELRFCAMRMEIRKEPVTLIRGQSDDSFYQLDSEIKRFASGLGMRPDQWMKHARQPDDLIVAEFEILVFVIVSMFGFEFVEPAAFLRRQRFVSGGHVGKPRVTASVLGHFERVQKRA